MQYRGNSWLKWHIILVVLGILSNTGKNGEHEAIKNVCPTLPCNHTSDMPTVGLCWIKKTQSKAGESNTNAEIKQSPILALRYKPKFSQCFWNQHNLHTQLHWSEDSGLLYSNAQVLWTCLPLFSELQSGRAVIRDEKTTDKWAGGG